MIVVREEPRNLEGGFRRVAVGVSERESDSAAVESAFREAELRGSGLTAVRTWLTPTQPLPDQPVHCFEAIDAERRQAREELDDAMRDAAAKHGGAAVDCEVVEGHPRRALLDTPRPGRGAGQ